MRISHIMKFHMYQRYQNSNVLEFQHLRISLVLEFSGISELSEVQCIIISDTLEFLGIKCNEDLIHWNSNESKF